MMVVIVDLCGTLVLENTTRGFLEHLRRQNRAHCLADVALSPLVSRFAAITGADIVRPMLIRSLRGIPKDTLYEEASLYVDDLLHLKLNEKVVRLIEDRKSKGAQFVLATASLDPIAAAVGRSMSFSRVISSKLEYRNGVSTGHLELDVRGAKWSQVMTSFPELANSEKIVAITDNAEDEDLRSVATELHYMAHQNAARKN